MASGQGPGPPREDCDDSPSPSAPTAEQQVAQDTEEVFRSYVFHLHHREQETQGAAAPANPEMDNLLLEPNNVLGQVGRQLAIIGDDINRRYDTEFQNLLEQLQPTAGNAYELFTKIASSPGCPGTCSVHQAGLKLTESCLHLPAPASRVLGLQAHATTAQLHFHLMWMGVFSASMYARLRA
ncbi:bcl-2 homologous antagonist/killer isoform X3 [Peromyscus maniculatus bairdii]|uniref:bcl-2 homologous antagonist/killer isoform X3 n=1 Tax=Peromyscus maniculatus bairdii TaxID=230844 RepID=UPI001C2E6ABE|nr:bcl-2 homologous antagonist/killer isoform X3 [Peromyscus maniculatus bairdii]